MWVSCWFKFHYVLSLSNSLIHCNQTIMLSSFVKMNANHDWLMLIYIQTFINIHLFNLIIEFKSTSNVIWTIFIKPNFSCQYVISWEMYFLRNFLMCPLWQSSTRRCKKNDNHTCENLAKFSYRYDIWSKNHPNPNINNLKCINQQPFDQTTLTYNYFQIQIFHIRIHVDHLYLLFPPLIRLKWIIHEL